MDNLQLKLCDIQGRLFELSVRKHYGSERFIKSFMSSYIAKDLDSEYNPMQWAGEEYLLAELEDSIKITPSGDEELYTEDVIYWIGYMYRFWHYYTGESSAKIIKYAPVKTLRTNYLMFHTMSPEMAIDDLKEINMLKASGKKGAKKERAARHI